MKFLLNRRVLLIKGVVALGLTSQHYLPKEYSEPFQWVANIIWLFVF